MDESVIGIRYSRVHVCMLSVNSKLNLSLPICAKWNRCAKYIEVRKDGGGFATGGEGRGVI